MRPSWMVLAMGVVGALPEVAAAQVPLNAGSPEAHPEAVVLGGTSTIDLIRLREGMLGAPLRFGGVIAGSERVELDGRRLTRGEEYEIDNAAGIVYLLGGFRPGQSLLVAYRHDQRNASPERSQAFGLGTVRFDLVPQAFGMVVGFGMTERFSDGNVLTSNLFGWNNSFSMGPGTLKGLYLLGDRQKSPTQSIFEYSQPGQAKDLGRSSLMLQDFSGKIGGGTITASYQDVSSKFSGFKAVEEAGYDAATVQRLQKEKGLTRMSLDVADLDLGGLKLGQSLKSIADGNASLDWRSFSLGYGGLNAFYSSQRVDAGFKRFKDIAEAERDQLAREAGMEREKFGLRFASGPTKLSFQSEGILDQQENGIHARSLQVESRAFKLDVGAREVDKAFSRMASLTEAERRAFGREIGTKRSWFDLSASLLPGAEQPARLSVSTIESDTGSFESKDVAISGKGWKLEHAQREVGEGFGSLSALQDAERDAHIKAIANMYQPGGLGFKPEDVNRFLSQRDVSRSVTRLSLAPAAGWAMSADAFRLSGLDGKGSVDTVNVSSKMLTFSFRKQELEGGQALLPSLMEFERQRLGTLPGLDKVDWFASLDLGSSRKLQFARMEADSPSGGASRQTLSYGDGKLDLSIADRKVDENFAGVAQLVDPERDLLSTMRGFSERDVIAKWQILPGLRLDLRAQDGRNASLDQVRFSRNYTLNWTPQKGTQLALVRLERRDDDPFQLLFGQALDVLSFAKDLGKFGSLKYLRESKDFQGAQANLPDSEKQYIAYETKLDPKTSFKTEQTVTTFEDGGKENVSANTLSTEIGKCAGVSVSDVRVDRDGDERDESKRKVGFWFDFGGGVRLSYGVDRQLAPQGQSSTQNQQASLTPGSMGNLQIGQASYSENRIDDVNTRTAGNIQVSTIKPFSLGFLSDLKLRASFDSQGDSTRLAKEQQLFRLDGKAGSNAFSVEYRSQAHPSGFRGIDRAFEFTTDQDEKNPLRFSVKYRMRSLPWAEDVMIRDYSLSWKPAKDVLLTHNLITNPTVDKPDAFLGSVVQARQLSRWKLDFNGFSNVKVGGQYEEVMDPQRPRYRTGGINLTLNAKSPSPVYLFYGIEQNDGADGRTTAHRYSLRFDQRPGPNQLFSVFVGNVSYQRAIVDGKSSDNWTLRLDWQWRF